MSVLKDRYEKEIKQSILKDMNLSSIMAVPKIEKIIINMGVKMAVSDKKYVERMYEFLERLIFIALPRVRDFQGIPRRGFDGNGNYNLGIKEHIIFPEISFDKTDAVKGLNITIVTTADNDEMARALLERVGLPFRAAPKSQENK